MQLHCGLSLVEIYSLDFKRIDWRKISTNEEPLNNKLSCSFGRSLSQYYDPNDGKYSFFQNVDGYQFGHGAN